uniref:Ribosomal protein L16 n=1 Tax=Chattonella marina TaxID=90936 RepID=D2Z218_9STRA|nr:ribosomal protein L16 [Chattonella marina]BAI70582.1 ribosomal protein L16 [Chattonella marina]
MFLIPKKTKYKKYQKGSFQSKRTSFISLTYGLFGLKCLESFNITSSQIEAVRQNINRKIKRRGKIWINVFPDFPITSKPSEVRMGKGKGSVDYWVSKVSAGKIIFEVASPNDKLAYNALKSAANKLPVKTFIIKR